MKSVVLSAKEDDMARGEKRESSYCLHMVYQPDSLKPERVFQAMTDMILGFGTLDNVIVGVLGIHVKTSLLLHEIESGSIRIWLASQLEDIPDEELRKCDLKAIIGRFLVKGKYATLDWLHSSRKPITHENLETVGAEITKLGNETKFPALLGSCPVNKVALVQALVKIGDGLARLNEKDMVSFDTGYEKMTLDKQIIISPAEGETLVTRESVGNTSTMILTVKKPDYLGTSQWDFKHGDRTISARLADTDWLDSFHLRKVDLKPGDAIKARVTITDDYGFDNEVIRSQYEVVKVIEVLQRPVELQGDIFEKS